MNPPDDLSALRAENQSLRQQFSNLLARIHRDGGHYAAEHGFHKAGEDAEKIVLNERQQLEESELILIGLRANHSDPKTLALEKQLADATAIQSFALDKDYYEKFTRIRAGLELTQQKVEELEHLLTALTEEKLNK